MSNEINDGGPAFPFEVTGRLMPDGGWLQTYESGMTLRDYFAGQALAGMLTDRAHIVAGLPKFAIAQDAYQLADAMIVARNGGTQ